MVMVPQVSFRFRKRVRLGKFLHVNLAQSGASLSVGRRGATVNLWRVSASRKNRSKSDRKYGDYCRG